MENTAKISVIKVKGTEYEINLPTTATPSITSLTVTGDLTVSGTANLTSISSNNNSLVISTSNLKLSAPTLTITTSATSPASYYPVIMSSTGRIYRSTLTIGSLSVYNSQRLGGTTASYYMRTDSNYYYVHNIYLILKKSIQSIA